MLLARVTDQRAETVRAALAERITTLPRAPVAVTDLGQGTEMSEHATFTVETGLPV